MIRLTTYKLSEISKNLRLRSLVWFKFYFKERNTPYISGRIYKFARWYFFVSLKKLQNASNVLIKHFRFDKALLAKRMRIRFSLLKKINLVYREFWATWKLQLNWNIFFKQISSRNWCNECLNKWWFLELIPFKLILEYGRLNKPSN